MMELVIFKRLTKFNHFDNNINASGKAFGIFFMSPFYKKEIYGNNCYANKSLGELTWWQRILHRDILSKYLLYKKGEYQPEDLGYGEWAGIVPWCIRFPVCFSSELCISINSSKKGHEIKTTSFRYGGITVNDIIIITDRSTTVMRVNG